MISIIMFLIVIPMIAYAAQFWAKKLRFVMKNFRTLADKAGRIKAAVSEAVGDEAATSHPRGHEQPGGASGLPGGSTRRASPIRKEQPD